MSDNWTDSDAAEYWSVDLYGLSAAGAAAVVEFARRREVDGDVVDPRHWVTKSLDRPIVEAVLRRCQGAEPEAGDKVMVEGFAEILEMWLEQAAPARRSD